MAKQNGEIELPLFRENYWFDADYRARQTEAAFDEREAEDAARRDELVDDLDSDAWIENVLKGLDGNDSADYYETGEDFPSFDDYVESTRVTGSMSISQAADYYGGSPAVLDSFRTRSPRPRSSYVSTSAYSSARGRSTQPSYRERVNKDVREFAVSNKAALEAFKASLSS